MAFFCDKNRGWPCAWTGRECSLPRIRSGAIAIVLGGLVGTGSPAAALAAEWLVEGRASVQGEFNDNIFLDPSNKLSVFGVTLSPEIDVGGRSEIWDVFLKTRLDFARFTEDDTLDSEDVTLGLDSSYRTQLGTWEFDATFKRLNTRTSELTDTGRVDARGERLEYELLPSWSYILTPRDSIFVNGGWNQAYFDEATLEDFTEYFAGAGWNHRLTEQDDITLSAFVSHFENDDVDGNENDTIATQVEWHRVFSDRLETRLAIGPRYVTTDSATRVDSDSSFGFVVDGSVDYDLDERTSISGNVSRSVDASGGGSAVERDFVGLSIRHQYEPRLSFSLAASYQENRDPNDKDDNQDRDYISIEPGVRWEFERDWFLLGSYRFRTQELAGESRAYSNAVFVTVSYRFPKWTFAH